MFKMLCALCSVLLCGSVLAKDLIVIISDSTAVNYRGKKNPITRTASWSPMSGWGECAADDVRKGVDLINRSAGGYSSKTWCNRFLAKYKKEFRKGGWLLLSFGSNDSRPSAREDRTTKPETTYPEYMNKIAGEAKKAGMNVVIISPLPYCDITKGRFAPTRLAPYAQACRKLAKENGYYFIDAYTLIYDYLKAKPVKEIRSYYMFLKPGDSPNWPKGRADMLHFNEKGTKMVWTLMRSAISRDIPGLAKLLKDSGKK